MAPLFLIYSRREDLELSLREFQSRDFIGRGFQEFPSRNPVSGLDGAASFQCFSPAVKLPFIP